MGLASVVLTRFQKGEVSDLITGLVDAPELAQSLKTCENMLPLIQGPVQMRPGLIYVGESDGSGADVAYLYRYERNDTQAYILEFTDNKIRIYTNGARITAVSITVGTWALADIPALKFAHDKDLLYIFHPSYHTKILQRTTDDNTWTLTDATMTDGLETLTLDAAPTPNAWVRGAYLIGQTSGVTAVVANVVSTTQYKIRRRSGTFTDGEIISDGVNSRDCGIGYPIIGAATNAFNSSGNYPSCGCFFESRLIVACTNNDKQSVWASRVGNYTAFDGLANPASTYVDDGWWFPLADERAAKIQWVTGGSDLLIGTTGAAWIMTGNGSPLGIGNVMARPQVHVGAANLMPAKINQYVLYLTKDGESARALQFVFQSNGYQAPDITTAARNIARGGITQWAVQNAPAQILWAIRADGTLLSFSFEGENLAGWARHVTDGAFESVAVIPYGSEDQVWVSVRRTINGTTKRYIEYFSTRAIIEAKRRMFVDSGKIYDAGTTYPISAITLTNPIRITTSGVNPFVDGELIRLVGIVGTTQLNDEYFYINQIDTTHFDLYLDSGLSVGIDGTLEKLTLDVAPSPDNFIVGGTITGSVSGNTAQIVQVIDSKNYYISARSGAFTDGETLDDGTNSANCGTGFPLVDAYYDPWVSGGTAQKFWEILTGLSHLEAKSVAVLADGATHPYRTVSSGQITLQAPANYVVVGLPFVGIMAPLRIEGGGETGHSLGKTKRIYKVHLRLVESLGCKAGQSLDNLKVVPFREGSDLMDQPPPVFTGDKHIEFSGDYTSDNFLYVVQDQPLPLTVAALAIEMETYEGS